MQLQWQLTGSKTLFSCIRSYAWRPSISSARVRSCSLIISLFFYESFSVFFFVSFFTTDSRALGYEETVIITLATVFVLAVIAVAAFFGYRMMHGEFTAAARRRVFLCSLQKLT